MTLQGRQALVTGAAEGLGRAIALRLARAGAAVVVADLQDASETVRLLRAEGVDADQVRCDVSSEDEVAEAVAGLGGRVDVLVNNAGVNGENHLVVDMPLDRWERTLRVNLTGTMLVTRAVAPGMIAAGGGRIVNVASNVAKRGLPFRADYVASKWAILGLTQTLALELAEHGIRVNAVCPGPVEGDRIEQVMHGHAVAEGRSDEDVRRQWEAEAPMKRFVDPAEVADVVHFLVSDASSAMTGQAVNVTGGLIMH